jgi:hypothetical protein
MAKGGPVRTPFAGPAESALSSEMAGNVGSTKPLSPAFQPFAFRELGA